MTSNAAGIDSFIYLYAQIAPKQYNPVYYYPDNALKRIRESQMAIFYEECAKDGLLIKTDVSYSLSRAGLEAVAAGDTGKLLTPYRRAKKRINLLYVDILI
jgi:hypothetical protein